jgi:hypothetical protein
MSVEEPRPEVRGAADVRVAVGGPAVDIWVIWSLTRPGVVGT